MKEILTILKSINDHLAAIRERLSPEHHYDSFPLILHSGEQVVTKEEAEEWRCSGALAE